jgi:hypothetical protein
MTDFGEKISNIKFRENPSSVKRVVPCEWKYGRTCMTELTVAFRNTANAPLKNTFGNSFISQEVGLI